MELCNFLDMFEYIIIGSLYRIIKCDHFEERYNVTLCQKWMTPIWLYLSMIHRKYNQHTTNIYTIIPDFAKGSCQTKQYFC